MNPSVFLFDLDMTLVDSSALTIYRAQGHWTHVDKNLDMIVPIGGSGHAHLLPSQLRALGHKVGVVTSSPRWYAEKVLQRFGVTCDALVAFGDTALAKPSRQPILRALELLGSHPPEAVYIGDDAVDVEAAYHAKVLSVGAGWGKPTVDFSSVAPDVLLTDVPGPTQLQNLDARGYLAELEADEKHSRWHPGSVLGCENACGQKVLALGRYFTAKDRRHAGHRLTQGVLAAKEDPGKMALFAPPVATVVNNLSVTPDYVVTVPPKPGESDRFAQLRIGLFEMVPDSVSIINDGLTSEGKVHGYKGMGAHERALRIRGAYSTSYQWEGACVMLIDDVHTTGSTLEECTRTLLDSGADCVIGLALGKSQRPLVAQDCPKCGREMRIRTNSHNGSQFWGCTGWPKSCTWTLNLC